LLIFFVIVRTGRFLLYSTYMLSSVTCVQKYTKSSVMIALEFVLLKVFKDYMFVQFLYCCIHSQRNCTKFTSSWF